jgi:predicted amino acid racemase
MCLGVKSQMKEIVYLKGIKLLGLKTDTDCVHCDVGTDIVGMP